MNGVTMMFLDCPAWLDEDGTIRCGLPAEVRCRFVIHSSDGPLESAMIRCPSGHWFNGPVGSLTRDRDTAGDPERTVSRPYITPAYYLGRPGRLWIAAIRPRGCSAAGGRAADTGIPAGLAH